MTSSRAVEDRFDLLIVGIGCLMTIIGVLLLLLWVSLLAFQLDSRLMEETKYGNETHGLVTLKLNEVENQTFEHRRSIRP